MVVVDVKSTVPEASALLEACLASVCDFRKARRRVHPLVGVPCLAVLALMAGARSLSDVSRWGKLLKITKHQKRGFHQV
ncbi:MAG: transposase family protein [Chloroflexi bacterium]|nr:transposase family protein [Chloroflexota bacterium]